MGVKLSDLHKLKVKEIIGRKLRPDLLTRLVREQTIKKVLEIYKKATEYDECDGQEITKQFLSSVEEVFDIKE